MNIYCLSIKYLALSACVILLLGACSKNNVYIDLPNSSGNGGSPGNGGDASKALVTFSAAIESRDMTRAMSPMNKGLQSWLAAYLSTETDPANSNPVTAGRYITSSVGMLTGVEGYKMYLSNDTYTLYAVSCNSPEPAPTFTKGVSEPLSNGVDYLWWNALHQDVTSTQLKIPITYQHAAAQLVVMVAAGTNITLNKITSATITPTRSGATMELATGIITPATGFGQAVPMGINEFTIQSIMLPVTTSDSMTLTLEILVNQESVARTYTVPIVPPGGTLAAGSSYLYRAIISEYSISFPNVSIKEWTEVDRTGRPLYPIQN